MRWQNQQIALLGLEPIDQIFALTMPGDNGHDYSHDTVAAMAAATKPTDWSAGKSRELQRVINTSDFSKSR